MVRGGRDGGCDGDQGGERGYGQSGDHGVTSLNDHCVIVHGSSLFVRGSLLFVRGLLLFIVVAADLIVRVRCEI